MQFMSESGRVRKDFTPNAWSKYGILLASMVVIMGAATVAASLGGMEDEFGEGKFKTSFVVTLPALAVALFGFPMGILADKAGNRFTLSLSLLIFAVFGCAGGMLDDLNLILVCRFMVGVGIAGIATSTNALISIYYSGPERGKVIALQAVFMGIGCVVLEFLGGFLADYSWRYPFYIYAIGVPILIVVLIGVHDMAPKYAKGELASLPERTVERRKAKIVLCYVAVFMAMFALYIIPTNMSDYFTDALDGMSMTVCGLTLGFLGVSQAVVAAVMPRIQRLHSVSAAFVLGFLMQAVGLLLMVPYSFPLTFIGVCLIGGAMGLIVPNCVANLSVLAPRGKEGVVMGGNALLMNFGAFVSAIVVGAYLESHAFDEMFLLFGIVFVVFAVLHFAAVRGVFKN